MTSKTLLSILVGCAILAPASAQLTIGPGTNVFVDIAGTGTALPNVGDDSSHGFTSTIGNDLFPAGSVVVTSNGTLISGAVPGASIYANGPIIATTDGTTFGYTATNKVICAFWDDLYGVGAPNATIFWQELSGLLIVQWQNIGHFATSSAAGGPGITFQVQIQQGGGCAPSQINMVYPDATFGGVQAINDLGASATVGYVGGTAALNAQHSSNQPVILDGTSLTILLVSFQQAWSSPFGNGSIQFNVCGGSPLGAYQLLVTLNAGLFPNGWLYGIDITYPEIFSELGVPPFHGLLDTAGIGQIGPIGGVPSGLTVYSVTFNIPNGSVPTIHTNPGTYTVP